MKHTRHILKPLVLAVALIAAGRTTASSRTVTYTLSGGPGQDAIMVLDVTASGGATGTAHTSWAFSTATSVSVGLPGGIALSFGTNKSSKGMAVKDDTLLIEGTSSTGGYITLTHDSYYVYHVTLKDMDGNVIQDAWNKETSYTYRFEVIRFHSIVVEYADKIPFTGAVISGISGSYPISNTPVTPMPTVTWHGMTLTRDTHYTLEYRNCETAGNATVIAYGKGIFSSTPAVIQDFTLVWATYTVRFHKNDGGDDYTDQAFYYTEEKALTVNAFSRTGCTFDGWSATAGGEVVYTDGQSVSNLTTTNGTVVHLYAKWTPVTYSITYNLNGGSVSQANPTTYDVTTSTFTLNNPTQPYCTFTGWTGTGLDAPALTVTVAQGSTGDRTYTANWSDLWGVADGADGTESRPYLITTTQGLDLLASEVKAGNSFSGQFFQLDADIAYSTVGLGSTDSNFTQIGGYFDGSDKDFCGTFDGNGHIISGIRIYKPLSNQNVNKNLGLFGRTTGATVKNVILADAVFTGNRLVGGIVGNCTSSTVKNCIVLGGNFTGRDRNVGAILGNKGDGTTLTANYYRNCTITIDTNRAVNVGVGGNGGLDTSADQNGARSIHTLALGEHITATGTSVSVGGTKYFSSNTSVTLNYDGLPQGYHVSYSYNDGSDHVLTGKTFTMPAADVSVSAALSSPMDDFALAPGTKDGVSAYWGTFYDSTTNFTLSEGATAYTMGSDYHLYRLGDDGRTIPKGTAVVVIATAPGVTLTPAGTNRLSGITVHGGKNILVGNDVATGYDSICILSVDSVGEIGFFKLRNFTLPAFKAGYLPPVDGGLEDYELQDNQRW